MLFSLTHSGQPSWFAWNEVFRDTAFSVLKPGWSQVGGGVCHLR